MFSRRFKILHAFAFLALLLAAGQFRALSAQNVVTNPHFDTDLAGWNPLGTVSWDGTVDANSSTSGSAKGTFDAVAPTGSYGVIDQCVPLALGVDYQFGGDVYIPSGNTGTGSAFFNLTIYPTAGCAGAPPPGPNLNTVEVSQVDVWTSTHATFNNSFGRSARIGAYIEPTSGGRFQADFDELDVTPSAAGTCTPDDHTLCFLASRFQVTATFDTGDGSTGPAHAVPIGNSGYLWFFSSDNPEVVVKMLNGCSLGGNFWFFAGGLTNVRVKIVVTDTRTHAVKVYANPLHTAFQPIQDTGAFPCF